MNNWEDLVPNKWKEILKQDGYKSIRICILISTWLFALGFLVLGILMCLVWGMSNANETIPSSLTWLANFYNNATVTYIALSISLILSAFIWTAILTILFFKIEKWIDNNKQRKKKSSKNSGGFK